MAGLDTMVAGNELSHPKFELISLMRGDGLWSILSELGRGFISIKRMVEEQHVIANAEKVRDC